MSALKFKFKFKASPSPIATAQCSATCQLAAQAQIRPGPIGLRIIIRRPALAEFKSDSDRQCHGPRGPPRARFVRRTQQCSITNSWKTSLKKSGSSTHECSA